MSNLSYNGTILLSGKRIQWQMLARIEHGSGPLCCVFFFFFFLLTITWFCSMLVQKEFTCTVYQLADHFRSEYSLFIGKSQKQLFFSTFFCCLNSFFILFSQFCFDQKRFILVLFLPSFLFDTCQQKCIFSGVVPYIYFHGNTKTSK